ncbi:MAG: ribonuclease III [Actinomycetota bacterium]
MSGLKQAAADLGLDFNNEKLLRQALTHLSNVYEHNLPLLDSNEKLEFLGDTILGYVITNIIYARFPDLSEGQLSKFRARLVNTGILADVAREINLGSHLLLGHGEEVSGGRDKTSILANSFEAIIGAYYLDQGLDAAHDFIFRLFEKRVDEESTKEASADFKTRLQELTVKKFGLAPEYNIYKETGPDHHKMFHAQVSVGRHVYGKGKGTSKKEAEQAAAKEALQILE